MKRSTLIILIFLLVLLLGILIFISSQIAPFFTFSILGIFLIIFLYILTEQWMTHDAAEFENRFWTLMAFILAATCLFCEDSPFKFYSDKPGLAWLIVVAFTFLAHNYDRHLRRVVLSRAPNIRKIKSTNFGTENRINAHQKMMELRELVTSIDQKFMSSTLLNFFFLPRVLYVEHQIITVFQEANVEELNLIICGIELALILYKMKDHKIAGRYNRTKLLQVLASDRVRELTVPSRAVLLDSFQRMKLSANPHSETFVKNIILATKTDDLSELKSLMDSKGDIYSMHRLIFVDLRDVQIRESILKYISAQANVQAAHASIGTKRGKWRGKFAWRKILSDVDDTLTCSGGSWPAGMDTKYPKKAVYPGVMAFYRELDLGTTGNEEWDNSRIGNLVFLSARPHVYKDTSENVSFTKFKKLQEERGLYTCPSLLAGSLSTGSQFMVNNQAEPLAIKKFENFREFLALYPEYTCILIGDNGQGDVRTAEMVLDDPRFEDNLHRVYIHQVQKLAATHCVNPVIKNPYVNPLTASHIEVKKTVTNVDKPSIKDPSMKETLAPPIADSIKKRNRICYFDTYIEAAIDAYKHNLIRATGLRRIMVEALADMLSIPTEAWHPNYKGPKDSGKKDPATRGRTDSSLDGPIVESASQRNASPQQLSTRKFTISGGKPVTGLSIFRGKKATALNFSNFQILVAVKPGATQKGPDGKEVQVKVPPNTLVNAESLSGAKKRESRYRELNTDLIRANKVLKELKMEEVSLLNIPQLWALGSEVLTMFGTGVISSYDGKSGIYEVMVQWDLNPPKVPVTNTTYPSSAPSKNTVTAKAPPPTTSEEKVNESGAVSDSVVVEKIVTEEPPTPSFNNPFILMYIPGTSLNL